MLHNYKSWKELPTSVKVLSIIGIIMVLAVLPLMI